MIRIDPLPFALLAKAAYQPPYDVNVGSFRALLLGTPQGACLSICGTDDLVTVLTDMESVMPWWSEELGCFVPAGFWHAVDRVWADICTLIASGHSLKVITGHSLGGALAVLLAARMCAAGMAPAGMAPDAVIAFAPPRTCIGPHVADLFAKRGVNVQLYRLGEDVIPDLPAFFGHPKPLIELGRADTLLDDHEIDHIIAACQAAKVVA